MVKKERAASLRCTSMMRIWIFVILLVTIFVVYLMRNGIDASISYEQQYDLWTSTPQSAFILSPPMGKAIALPSIRVPKTEAQTDEIYGGAGDKPHLGGFTDLDEHGVSPAVWKWMVQYLGVHSVLDVGCGRGISTSWFYFHGVDVLCVEGSHDAVENTVLPDPITNGLIVEHDFARGPWWPEKTYDAVWCVEFLEHVGRNFHKNYVPAFRSAALIIVTHSEWGGHHHVEVHDDDYWIAKFTMFGFIYSPTLTETVRQTASEEQEHTGFAPNGVKLNAQHVWTRAQVFINPAVAALPQHAHLLGEPGCYDTNENGTIHRECGSQDGHITAESVLPESMRALTLTQAQDEAWMKHLKPLVKQKAPDGSSTDSN